MVAMELIWFLYSVIFAMQKVLNTCCGNTRILRVCPLDSLGCIIYNIQRLFPWWSTVSYRYVNILEETIL